MALDYVLPRTRSVPTAGSAAVSASVASRRRRSCVLPSEKRSEANACSNALRTGRHSLHAC
jgi:hypothetical protein